jgi:hypothetical protein
MNSLMGKKCLFSFYPHTTSTHTIALDRLLIFVVALRTKKECGKSQNSFKRTRKTNNAVITCIKEAAEMR